MSNTLLAAIGVEQQRAVGQHAVDIKKDEPDSAARSVVTIQVLVAIEGS
jgi:hypothetical protein